MAKEKKHTPLPFFYVGKEVTEKRIKKFMETRYKHLCQVAPKTGETKSIWYSREHIAKLLEELDNARGNGMRISFGVYEDGHEYENQMCLLFNITRESKQENSFDNINVSLEDEPDFKPRHEDFMKAIANEDFNLGRPCPPRCDGGVGGG